MSKRTKIAVVVILGVIMLLLIVLVALAPRRRATTGGPANNQQPAPGGANQGLPGAGSVGTPATPTTEPPVTKEPKTQATVEALAKTFAERYGSFSSHSGTANVRELRPIMTTRLAATAEATVARALPATGFYGITTKVLHTQIIALNESETEAQVVVQTQRSENRGVSGGTQFYQQLSLRLVQESDAWKVDQATWQ